MVRTIEFSRQTCPASHTNNTPWMYSLVRFIHIPDEYLMTAFTLHNRTLILCPLTRSPFTAIYAYLSLPLVVYLPLASSIPLVDRFAILRTLRSYAVFRTLTTYTTYSFFITPSPSHSRNLALSPLPDPKSTSGGRGFCALAIRLSVPCAFMVDFCSVHHDSLTLCQCGHQISVSRIETI